MVVDKQLEEIKKKWKNNNKKLIYIEKEKKKVFFFVFFSVLHTPAITRDPTRKRTSGRAAQCQTSKKPRYATDEFHTRLFVHPTRQLISRWSGRDILGL